MLQLGRLEAERAAAALVGDLAVAVDQVEPAGHAAVAGADGVVDRVDQHREAQAEPLRRRSGRPRPAPRRSAAGRSETPTRSLLSIDQPSVGWASRT